MISKINQWLKTWQEDHHERRMMRSVIRGEKNNEKVIQDSVYLEMESLWNDLDLLKDVDFPARKKARNSWFTMAHKINRQRLVFNACAISCILIMSVLIWHTDPWPTQENIYENMTNNLTHLSLPDGSEIDMNIATRLQVKFYRTRREIILNSGEAYFKVKHDPEKPFIVITENSSVRAVGTAFNVFKGTDEVEVAVAEGIVEVTISENQERVLLHQGELLLHNNANLLSHAKLHFDDIAMWRQGKILFHETPLLEVVSKLKRYGFDIPVSIDDDVATLKVSGSYRVNKPIELLQTLSEVFPITILEDKEHIFITANH